MSDDLKHIGRVNKTHGVGGELSLTVDDPDWLDAVMPGVPLLMSIDGIFVPFFVAAVRPRGTGALLVTLEDVASQTAAAPFTGKDVYMRASDLPESDDDDDTLYAQDMVGFTVYLSGSDDPYGTIDSVDDTTENALFVISRPSAASPLLVPVVEDFIDGVDVEDRSVTFNLPEGLLDL